MRMEVEMGMIYMGVWILVFLHDLFNLHIPDVLSEASNPEVTLSYTLYTVYEI